MHNRVLKGKIEFIAITIVNLTLAILIAPITSFIVPIIYFLVFWALYRGHRAVRGILAFLNLLGVFLFSSITFIHHSILVDCINIVIPIILIILTILIFVGKSRYFIRYKSLIREKRLSKLFDYEEGNY